MFKNIFTLGNENKVNLVKTNIKEFRNNEIIVERIIRLVSILGIILDRIRNDSHIIQMVGIIHHFS